MKLSTKSKPTHPHILFATACALLATHTTINAQTQPANLQHITLAEPHVLPRIEDVLTRPPRLNDPAQFLPLIANPSFQQLDVPVADAPDSLTVNVTINNQPVTLQLARANIRTSDFKVEVFLAGGQRVQVDPGPERTYRGVVAGLPESLVTATLKTDGRLTARIALTQDDVWHIEELVTMGEGMHVIFRSQDVEPLTGSWCGTEENPGEQPQNQPANFGVRAGVLRARITVECDWEWYSEYGSDTVNEMAGIINDNNAIYDPQVGICYAISYVGVWDNPFDPYTTDDSSALLAEFSYRMAFAEPYVVAHRTVAQLFTGRELDGSTVGKAYRGGINYCGFRNVPFSDGYTEEVQAGWTSRYRATSILQDILIRSRRVELSAHELGHNWNATHCDGDDTCGIMSSTITSWPVGGRTSFGLTSANQIISRRSELQSCLRACDFDGSNALCTGYCAYGTTAAAHASVPAGANLRILPRGNPANPSPNWFAKFVWNRPMLITAPNGPVILGE